MRQALVIGHGIDVLQNFQHLIEQPRGRDFAQQRGQAGNRLGRVGGQFEVQLVGDAHRAQHAHRVFAIPRLDIANHANHPGLQVVQPAAVVDDAEVADVVIQGVDGEIAAEGIGFQRAVHVVRQDAAGVVTLHAVADGAAEGGQLDHFAAKTHVADHEAASDQPATAEQRLDLFGMRVGGNVEILRRDAGEDVADPTADQVRLEPGIAQGVKGSQRRRRQHRT